MQKTMTRIRRTFLYIMALLLASGYPMIAMADTPAATPSDATVAVQEVPVAEQVATRQTQNAPEDATVLQLNTETGTYEAAPVSSATSVPPSGEQSGSASSSGSTALPAADQSSPSATTNVSATNQTASAATTGNAAVSSNTTAGSATTGTATATATILNNVNSVITANDNQKAANFTYDVMGDVNGDIMLYPLLLKSMIESNVANGPSSDTSISATQNNALTNDISLQATSGNALVTNNTNAGDATSGSAHTVANVVNVLNSMIAANKSFIGTINIYGNLNGDILVAPDFIPQMIASNGGTQTTSTGAETTIQSTDTQTIINNVALAAQSGSAAVTNNTTAGNATSGSADTNVVIFNLSGHAIIAKNSLLVFVNVLGKWVGVIVDAPTGATSALVGNDVSSDTVATPDLTVHTQANNAITNNIALSSKSGNAVVNGNTNAGSATSGNATASANIANISSSQLGISDWFGVLFINVFSSWYGSFGVNTAYGDPVAEFSAIGQSRDNSVQPFAIAFVPRAAQAASTTGMPKIIDGQVPQSPTNESAELGATSTAHEKSNTTATKTTPQAASIVRNDFRLPIVIGSLFVIGLTGLALRRLLSSVA